MISAAKAEEFIRDAFTCFGTENISLTQAYGRVLASHLSTERQLPPFDRVAMDGIAIALSHASQEVFRLEKTQAAGAPETSLEDPRKCIEVMTGAMLPRGCDCVIPFEQITFEESVYKIKPDARLQSFANVHRRGSDCAQGFEFLKKGTRLDDINLSAAASNGNKDLEVFKLPKVAIISTGSELVDLHETPQAHQIRRSNVYGLQAALRAHGCTQVSMHHYPDRMEGLSGLLEKLVEENDVLMLSGGVSKGKFDFVPETLAKVGVEKIFHRVAQKPGKPFWFGRHHQKDTLVFAFPGNPVSTAVCLHRYFFPTLFGKFSCTDSPVTLTLREEIAAHKTLTLFKAIDHESYFVPSQGSGDFISLLGTKGFVELPPQNTPHYCGTQVKFYSWSAYR